LRHDASPTPAIPRTYTAIMEELHRGGGDDDAAHG
jgi:hypothetical protein